MLWRVNFAALPSFLMLSIQHVSVLVEVLLIGFESCTILGLARWAFYDCFDDRLAFVPILTAADFFRIWKAIGRCIVANLHARLESLGVVDGLLVVKHALSFVVRWARHLLLLLFNCVEEGLALGFRKATPIVDLLLREENLFEVRVVVWTRYEGSLIYRTLLEINTALLPIEVRVMIRLEPLVFLHILRRYVDVVAGGTGRQRVYAFLKDASLRLVTRNGNTCLLFAQ